MLLQMDVEPRLVFKPLLDGGLKLVLGLSKYELSCLFISLVCIFLFSCKVNDYETNISLTGGSFSKVCWVVLELTVLGARLRGRVLKTSHHQFIENREK
jgi:hypothetical protein